MNEQTEPLDQNKDQVYELMSEFVPGFKATYERRKQNQIVGIQEEDKEMVTRDDVEVKR